jgi:uncharacterized protein (TIGR00296 family)
MMELLTDDEGRIALMLARHAIEHRIAKKPRVPQAVPPVFAEKRGVFVTLKDQGDLRGCIGFPYPVLPLGDAIRDAAVAAAVEDPRFPPVTPSELPSLELEVTVLTVPELLACLPIERPERIEIGRHGLIVRGMGTSGLLLPQVPVEWNWNAAEFLHHTCMKAGLPAKCWQNPSVELYTFEGQIFSERGTSPGDRDRR